MDGLREVSLEEFTRLAKQSTMEEVKRLLVVRLIFWYVVSIALIVPALIWAPTWLAFLTLGAGIVWMGCILRFNAREYDYMAEQLDKF
jgi:hypothetical protein